MISDSSPKAKKAVRGGEQGQREGKSCGSQFVQNQSREEAKEISKKSPPTRNKENENASLPPTTNILSTIS